MTSILITGISGRMGRAIREAIELNPEACEASTHDQGEDLAKAMQAAQVTIDFSHHSFTSAVLAEALKEKKALVIGTTGHSDAERAEIVAASKHIPIVYASNYSIGVNTLFWLTRKAARVLNEGFDREIIEMHHHHKIDAPSGTARRLLEILCEEADLDINENTVHGRQGVIGARPVREIGMHSLRGGDVVGDHTVIFAADGERVELTHKASSRLTFASGAVHAALWVIDQHAGLYDMEDVLGLKN